MDHDRFEWITYAAAAIALAVAIVLMFPMFGNRISSIPVSVALMLASALIIVASVHRMRRNRRTK